MSPKVSVVIPVYKVEAYIERCARSLFGQTLDAMEYIFVDDCSPDASIEILQRVLADYPARTAQVKIIRQERNKGVAAAREAAIKAATGEYLTHCDSDDWVATDAYERLYAEAKSKELDIVWFDYYETDGTHEEHRSQAWAADKTALLKAYLDASGTLMNTFLWNRLYKRELHDAEFVYPTHNMCEDLVIALQLLLRSKRIGHLPAALYYYYQSPDSITRCTSEERILRQHADVEANVTLACEIVNASGLNPAEFRREIESKKLACKDMLLPLVGEEKYRRLWVSSFREINRSIWFNGLVPAKRKVRALLLFMNIAPVYALADKLRKRRAGKK